MIIRFPTGLYRNVLPKSPSDSGSVTYLISNSEPPRTDLLFPKIPNGVLNRKRISRDAEPLRRRKVVGSLAFTVSKSSRDISGNDDKILETGQVLEFSDSPVRSVDPMLVGNDTQIRHDINTINYQPLDVSDDELQAISDAALMASRSLAERLNDVRQKRKNAEQLVVTNQKIINDANRTINALRAVVESSEAGQDIVDLIIKLESRKTQAFVDRDAATADANVLAVEASKIQDEIRTISVVLR